MSGKQASKAGPGGWAPHPTWQELPSGVWRVDQGEDRWIVKRLHKPRSRSGLAQLDSRHHSWWRREAEVAREGILADSSGLIPPRPTYAVEDEEGVCLWTPEIAIEPIPDEILANAYGRFATQEITDPGWFNRGMLRHRIVVTDSIGGIAPLREQRAVSQSLLSRCERVWQERYVILEELDRLPLVLSHGDALPRNMLRREDEHVLAIDWAQLGYNTVGADLASLYLYSSTEIGTLVTAYVDGLAGARQTDAKLVRYATIRIAALIAVFRAARAVGAEQDVHAYIGRLVRAEPLLAEVSR